MRRLYKQLSEYRIACIKCLPVLCICMTCLVFKGCVPENISLPGSSSNTSGDTPSDTVVASPVTVPEAFTNYFETGISLSYTADEVEVVFKVDIDWMMQVVDDAGNPATWCNLSSDLGSAGLHKVKVGVKENPVRASRSAHIMLRALDASKMAEIAVTQEGVTLFLERTRYEVAPKDTTIAVELKANVDFEYKIIGADWVREQPTASRALTTSNLAFEVDANPSHKSREMHILFYNSQYPVAADTLTIVQLGLTPTATVPDEYTNYFAEDMIFSHVKGEAEVTFHSNVEWTLQVADSTAWCSVSQTSGKAGLQKVKVSVTDNDTYEHRSAVLRLMCDTTEMGEIHVVQNRENAILLGRQDYTVSCEATTIDVSLSTNVDFEYKIIDADWVRERQSATRGLTTHNLTFEVDANPSHKPRETRIVFYSSEYAVADTLTIVQKGIPLSVITGDATNVTASRATLNGMIGNAVEPLTCGIIFGTSSTLSSTSGTRRNTTSQGDYSITWTGLVSNTTYYYRAYVIYAGEFIYGEVKSFTTKSVAVTTGDATNVTTSSATLAGTINNAEQSLACGIIYGTSSSLSSTSGTMKSTMSSDSYSISLAGLIANTTYYYRAYVIDSGSYKYGEVRVFKTNKSLIGNAIDLGLSVKWASWNVGASSPEDYGSYYAWGETEGKSDYSWNTYKWCEGDDYAFWITKYCSDDGMTTLDPEDDVAHVKWGGSWRLPTKDEIDELRDKCSLVWGSMNGISGVEVTGPNGNSIFLPATGYFNGTELRSSGSYCRFWSSTLSSSTDEASNGFSLQNTNDNFSVKIASLRRQYGYSVRPVTE